jgi:hypothetical protein
MSNSRSPFSEKGDRLLSRETVLGLSSALGSNGGEGSTHIEISASY